MPWKSVSFPKLTQSWWVPIQMHGQSELDWVSFWKKKKKKKILVFKVVILCVGMRAGWWWWTDGGVYWWVCGCVNKVSMEVTRCGDGCVVVGLGGCVLRWMSEFWTSGILNNYANTHYKAEKEKKRLFACPPQLFQNWVGQSKPFIYLFFFFFVLYKTIALHSHVKWSHFLYLFYFPPL